MEGIEISKEVLDSLYDKARDRVKQSDMYRQITKRKYRSVRGYQDWLDVMVEFVFCLQCCTKGMMALHENVLLMLSVQLMNVYISKRASSYWLDRDLADIFLHCDIPEGLSELPSFIPYGLLFLPLDKAPVDSNGNSISWILFYKAQAGEELPVIFYGSQYAKPEPIEKDCILWVSQAKDSSFYSGAIAPDFKTHVVTPDGLSASDSEAQLTNTISSLLIQSLLVAQHYPEWSDREENGGGGFGKTSVPKSSRKENTWLNPKWIGNLYVKAHKPRKDLGGTHASPTSHTRRGHWRNQAYGEKWSQRRMIIIQQTDVNKRS
ncbi:hypothetical protein [Scytonema sp. NUACC26]|uniref:hypothetical protein n=1 Tax=Scytonema sp. NUACC26 TaxID=3140176 RepID=UPI0034DC5254